MRRLSKPFCIISNIAGILSMMSAVWIACSVEATTTSFATGTAMIVLFGWGIWCMTRGELIEW